MTAHLGTTMLDYCPYPDLGLLSKPSPPPSFMAAATPLMHYLEYITLWVWSTLTLHNIAIVCAIAVVVLPASTCFIIDIFFPPPPPPPPPPPQVTPTTTTNSTIQGPIRLLPVELLVEVMANLDPGRPRYDDIYAAMRVCSAWRHAALSAPRLCKTTPLAVTLGSGASALHFALLFPHMHRLSALALVSLPPSEALAQLLLRPAPALRRFDIAIYDKANQWQWRVPSDLFAGQAPLLRDLSALPHQLPDAGTCAALAKVESFNPGQGLGVQNWDPTPADVAKVLRSFPALSSVVVAAPSAASADSSLATVRCPSNLQLLHVVSMTTAGWTKSTRAGLVQMLDKLPLADVLIWRADAAVVRDTLACPVNGARVTHLSYKRKERGGQLILIADTASARRSYVDVPFDEFAKTLQNHRIFAALTTLTVPGSLPASDLSLPGMPLLRRLQIVFTWEFDPDTCIFRLVRSRAISWHVPSLRVLAVLSKDLASTSTVKPTIEASDLVHFVKHGLVIGNGRWRLHCLTFSQRVQIVEDGGRVCAETAREVRTLTNEWYNDSTH
ncbi:hypothetical protein EXIGLDRAFT_829223 [Exidia glandulosa HHB12029]|uniref:Uncharacterized protein n=1 Tax=Exidia glandulosa HHB12029 TaxID=1314781 RepID=A0A165PVA2_EXIGL|nr:hypothetical protein EXIGLDRAFT_829223 [Exidia glandulosa HHB12029]